MKASALNLINREYHGLNRIICTYLMSRTPGMVVSVSCNYLGGGGLSACGRETMKQSWVGVGTKFRK